MIEIATSISCQENLLRIGIVLRGLVAYFLSWAFPRKQQVQVKDPEETAGRSGEELPKDGNVDLSCLKMRLKIKC